MKDYLEWQYYFLILKNKNKNKLLLLNVLGASWCNTIAKYSMFKSKYG